MPLITLLLAAAMVTATAATLKEVTEPAACVIPMKGSTSVIPMSAARINAGPAQIANDQLRSDKHDQEQGGKQKVVSSNGFLASNAGFTGELVASGLADQNQPAPIAIRARAQNTGAARDTRCRLNSAIRAISRKYMTPDVIRIAPANRCGCCSLAARRATTTVVTVDEYAPPKRAATIHPTALSCQTLQNIARIRDSADGNHHQPRLERVDVKAAELLIGHDGENDSRKQQELAGVTSEMSGLTTFLVGALVYNGHVWIATTVC